MYVWYQGVDLDREKEHGTLGKISCYIKFCSWWQITRVGCSDIVLSCSSCIETTKILCGQLNARWQVVHRALSCPQRIFVVSIELAVW